MMKNMPRKLYIPNKPRIIPENIAILDKYMENVMSEVKSPIAKAAKEMEVTYQKAYSAIKSKTVKEYLDELGLNNENAAKILMDKLKQHAELDPGEDKDTPKYLDMLFKITGSYVNKTELTVDTQSDALDFIQNIVKGDYVEVNKEEEEDEET